MEEAPGSFVGSPMFFVRVAERFYPHRWWLLATTVGAAVLPFTMACLVARDLPVPGRAFFPLLGVSLVLIGWSWGILCLTMWFCPVRGWLRRRGWPGPWKAVDWVLVGLRVWACAVLLLFVAISTVVGVIITWKSILE